MPTDKEMKLTVKAIYFLHHNLFGTAKKKKNVFDASQAMLPCILYWVEVYDVFLGMYMLYPIVCEYLYSGGTLEFIINSVSNKRTHNLV